MNYCFPVAELVYLTQLFSQVFLIFFNTFFLSFTNSSSTLTSSDSTWIGRGFFNNQSPDVILDGFRHCLFCSSVWTLVRFAGSVDTLSTINLMSISSISEIFSNFFSLNIRVNKVAYIRFVSLFRSIRSPDAFLISSLSWTKNSTSVLK